MAAINGSVPDLYYTTEGKLTLKTLITITEVLSTETEFKWPPLMAPYQICIIPQKVNQPFLEFSTKLHTVKPVLICHSEIDKTKILKTNGSLMKVESIAECSLGAFCNTFDLH